MKRIDDAMAGDRSLRVLFTTRRNSFDTKEKYVEGSIKYAVSKNLKRKCLICGNSSLIDLTERPIMETDVECSTCHSELTKDRVRTYLIDVN